MRVAARRASRTGDGSRRRRHPGDVLRVVLGGVVLAASAAVAHTGRVGTFEHDLFDLFNHLPSQIEGPVNAVMQAGALGAVFVSVALALAARRPRLARDLGCAGTAAWLLAKVLKDFVSRPRPGNLLPGVVLRHVGDTGHGFPSGHAAVVAALATAAGPFLPRRARHATWFVVALVGAARLYVGAHLPVDVVGGAALGWMVGAGLHLAVGAPTRDITVSQVDSALAAIGFDPATVTPLGVDARGSAPFITVTRAGQRLFVKAVSVENRNADLLFKLWRFLTLRRLEDEAPFATPKQQVEHEALLLLLAARAGVRVPGALTAVRVGSRPALLVLERLETRQLDELDASEVTPALLEATWEQVRRLRAARIAHRDLRAANILVGADAEPWIVDFGFAEVSASDHRLDQDVAQLLAALALLVGPDRAVDSAIDGLGAGTVSAAIPLLQPLALSAATRRALRHHREMLAKLRELAAERTGTAPPELERLTRVHPMTVVWLALALFAVHLLLPQVAELQQTLTVLGQAQPPWLLLALVTSAASYVAAATALAGSVVPTLPLGRTVAVELANSFANRMTPASLGGIGLSIRYLQRRGLSKAEAVGASGATILAGGMIHVGLLVATGVVVGRSGIGRVELPNRWIVLVVVVAVLSLAGFAFGTVPGRRRVLAPLGRSVQTVGRVLHRPVRAVQLFGGSLAVTSCYIVALFCALHAFGGDLDWTRVALAYLGAAAVGAASPTPGGLGAVEAALVAGLTALGADAGPSIAGVLAFRLATFWLPIAPGWVAFRVLHQRGVV